MLHGRPKTLPMNILVLCTGNSARSILLESILRRLGYSSFSAGSNPTGKVHPQSVTLLTELGYDVSEARSKSWDEFAKSDAPKMDVIITVCGSAAGETCPMWPGAPLTVHWGVEDPAAAEKSDWDAAFKTAYEILNRRAEAFAGMATNTPLLDRLKTAGKIQ